MKRYRFSRKLAATVVVLGLLAATTGLLFVIGILAVAIIGVFRSVAIAASVPFLTLLAAGLMLALLGCMARAFFDIAEAKLDACQNPANRQSGEAA